MDKELLPCPFCASKDLSLTDYAAENDFVCCDGCGITQALSLWNNRPIQKKIIEAAQRCADAENECQEQARLLGMSGEREAKLLSELDNIRDKCGELEGRLSERS